MTGVDARPSTATIAGCAGFTGSGVGTEVEVRTLPNLLSAYDLPNPSILVVDVEGLDAEIVLSALDAGMRPTIIMYESVHIPRERQAHCLRRLATSWLCIHRCRC
jgi:hypothetical protein